MWSIGVDDVAVTRVGKVVNGNTSHRVRRVSRLRCKAACMLNRQQVPPMLQRRDSCLLLLLLLSAPTR
ncbi:hypothetical protein E2C01_034783 [Portunus trituberculatus]|uniref:Uncharacterized protein n=1 Tax=Portunus trituberculatus TaxID=210409 RepID=A0A5B7F794_PORTR|nr:hypothetical protein [Portunus trituberculatus]